MQRCLVAMAVIKNYFKFTMSAVSCLYNYFLLVLVAMRSTVLIHALPTGN